MTFEDFFIKKRIDIDLLEKADPELCTEFRNHFEMMGEKSFDHTKKFWFNKLRHLYPLAVSAKAVNPIETKIASQAESLSSPTIEQKPYFPGDVAAADTGEGTAAAKPAGFKPRFKPRTVAATAEASEKKEEGQNAAAPESSAPPVKKPPFKPRSIKPVSEASSAEGQTTESQPGQAAEAPDAPVIKAPDTPLIKPEVPSDVPRPAYKPKFNIRNIPRNQDGTTEQLGNTDEEKALPEPQDTTGNNPAPEKAGAKPAYKPRFSMKNLPAKPSLEENEGAIKETEPEVKEEIPGTVNEKAETPETTERPPEEKPKPAYKPRFNVKNIKPKPEE